MQHHFRFAHRIFRIKKEHVHLLDKPGSIYVLKADNFRDPPGGDFPELVSDKPAKVVKNWSLKFREEQWKS